MIYLRSKKSDLQKEETQAKQGDYQSTIDWSKIDTNSTDPF